MKRLRLLRVLLISVFAVFVSGTAQAQSDPVVFARLSIPVGIAVDADGNVLVVSMGAFDNELVGIDLDGNGLGKMSLGFNGSGYIALDPDSGYIWQLSPTGEFRYIDPASGAIEPGFAISDLDVDVSSVYDLETGTFTSMGSIILPSAASTSYGDFALLRRGDQLDIVVSGLSAAFPFVLRIRAEGDQILSAQVIASSLTTTAPYSNQTRGIAINQQGMVLTTLPKSSVAYSIRDVAVAFSVDYPEKPTRSNIPRILFAGLDAYRDGIADFTSRGMTSDPSGKFYVATGSHGTTLCNNSGQLAVISANLRQIRCSSLSGTIINSQDVAVDPTGRYVYMTVLDPLGFGNPGTVIRFRTR